MRLVVLDSNLYGVTQTSWLATELASAAAQEAAFLVVIMGATDSRAPAGFAPLAIGLGLTLIHLVGIPVTNTSVNPARSLATAVFQGDWALGQVWAFIVFPAIGAAAAGGIWMIVGPQSDSA